MSRMLQIVLVLIMLNACGCSRVKDFFTIDDPKRPQETSLMDVEVEPEGLIHRSWEPVEVTSNCSSYQESSPYFNSYEQLDSNYMESGKTWNKSNAKRAAFDPFITIKNAITAPFKYSKDKYVEYKDGKKECDGKKCCSKNKQCPCD